MVPPGVTVVRGGAFCGCSNLARVEMPDLETVEECGFGKCPITSGTTITADDLPEGATEVPAEMFRDRQDITAVVLPGVTVVREDAFAFAWCGNLVRVEMPDRIEVGVRCVTRVPEAKAQAGRRHKLPAPG